MGNAFNMKLGKFTLNPLKDIGIQYNGLTSDFAQNMLARMGSLAFHDHKHGNLILFGGQKIGDTYKKSASRLISNDIVVFDYKSNCMVDLIEYSEAAVPARMYSLGFRIEHKLFVLGGMGSNGQLLISFKELDFKRKFHEDALIDSGANLLEKIHSSAITSVFYKSRFKNPEDSDFSQLSLRALTAEPNWGEATDLIKHEGFYIFGGRKLNNDASNRFLILKLS